MCFLVYAILCVFLYTLVDMFFKQCKDQLIITTVVKHHYFKHQNTSNWEGVTDDSSSDSISILFNGYVASWGVKFTLSGHEVTSPGYSFRVIRKSTPLNKNTNNVRSPGSSVSRHPVIMINNIRK